MEAIEKLYYTIPCIKPPYPSLYMYGRVDGVSPGPQTSGALFLINNDWKTTVCDGYILFDDTVTKLQTGQALVFKGTLKWQY
jgi:hypothetical protein